MLSQVESSHFKYPYSMNTQTQSRFATALILLPLLFGTVNHLLGGRSLTTSMNYVPFGPVIYPTRFSIRNPRAGCCPRATRSGWNCVVGDFGRAACESQKRRQASVGLTRRQSQRPSLSRL